MTRLRLTIATPCTADWSAMPGDERMRRCPTCDKNVYNAAALSRRELHALIAAREGGRLPCLRLYRRPDGTVVTRGCLTAARYAAGWLRMKTAVVAAFLFAFWTGITVAPGRLRALAFGGGSVAAAPAKKSPSKRKKQPPPPPPPPPAEPKPDFPETEMGLPDLKD